jgi:hypothetical protein
MRRRNSTINNRLDRRKSISSVRSVRLEHIQPQTAERDAHAAATEAFSRARERSATESSTPPWPPPRSTGPGSTRASLDEGSIHREKSIRFVPSKPSLLGPSVTISQNASVSHGCPVQRNLSAKGEPEFRPARSASASGIVSATKGVAGDLISTLFSSDERYTAEDDIASVPSSYRRLRKSKSMFTNHTAEPSHKDSGPHHPSASTNQLPSPANSRSQAPRSDENIPPQLKTPRSMTFLRDIRSNFGTVFRTDDTGAATPRTDGVYENKERPSTLRNKSSRFLRPKVPPADRGLRKSMREASNGTISTFDKTAKDRSLRYKARKVSRGFKHKLKNLFGLARGHGDEPTVPQQHIEAQRPHIFGLDELEDDTEYEVPDLTTDEGARSYIISRMPSLHVVPSSQKLRSRQGSIESIRGEQQVSDERSRVTSWSNSDTNTTTSVNSGRAEREKKRLSVIKENGTHVCSSSAQFPTVFEQASSSTASLRPPPKVLPVSTSADGPRIYSALMKRTSQSKQSQASELERKSSVDDFMKAGTVPQRKSSLRPRRLGGSIGSTIRYVAPESESESESSEATKSSHMGDVGRNGSPTATGLRHPLCTATRPTQENLSRPSTSRIYTNAKVAEHRDSDTKFQLTAAESDTPGLGQPLSSRSSAFFGSPTRHLFRTQSPFRRALQDRIQTEANEEPKDPPDINPWMRSLSNLPIRRPSLCGSDRDIKICYTESVYSTNTDDYPARKPSLASPVNDFPGAPAIHGEATIFADSSGLTGSSSLPRKQRVSSSSSSVEWKTWLSSNVSKLEESTTAQTGNDGLKYDLSSAYVTGNRHVREKAQIADDDEDDLGPGGFPKSDLDDQEQLPTPFDAGERDIPINRPYISYANSLTSTPSTSKVLYMGEPSHTPAQNNATGLPRPGCEKSLPYVPSLNSIAGRSMRHGSITSKLVKRRPGARASMTPLANRNPSGASEDQQAKVNLPKPQRKINGKTFAKPENMSPETTNEDDPYDIEGTGILGPNKQSTESKQMVDIFLSSRRRRLASSEEGSVFL